MFDLFSNMVFLMQGSLGCFSQNNVKGGDCYFYEIVIGRYFGKTILLTATCHTECFNLFKLVVSHMSNGMS